jgi:hypothetical protein
MYNRQLRWLGGLKIVDFNLIALAVGRLETNARPRATQIFRSGSLNLLSEKVHGVFTEQYAL